MSLIKVLFVDGTEKEIEIRDRLSSKEVNEIVNSLGRFSLKGDSLGEGFFLGDILDKIVRLVVVDKTIKIEDIEAGSYQDIADNFTYLFGLGKKNKPSETKSTE